MSQVSETMLIDRVDQSDAVIGPIERGRVFELKANFRVVHVFVLDRRGRLLLQQIPPCGKRHPGNWGSSVAGYVFSGEGYEEAARRRLGQELGVAGAELQFFGKVPMDDAGCTKFIALFTARHDGPFRPDAGHIAALDFVDLQDIPELHRRGERSLHPDVSAAAELLYSPWVGARPVTLRAAHPARPRPGRPLAASTGRPGTHSVVFSSRRRRDVVSIFPGRAPITRAVAGPSLGTGTAGLAGEDRPIGVPRRDHHRPRSSCASSAPIPPIGACGTDDGRGGGSWTGRAGCVSCVARPLLVAHP